MHKILIVVVLLIMIFGCSTFKPGRKNDPYTYSYTSSYSSSNTTSDQTTKQETVITNDLSNQYLSEGTNAYYEGDYRLCISKLDYVLNNLVSSNDFEEACIYCGAASFLLRDYSKAKSRFLSVLRRNSGYAISEFIFKPEIVKFFEECRKEAG